MKQIEKLRDAAAEYGRRSIENYKICNELGQKIIKAFDLFLDPEGGIVIGVPPEGEWDPEKGDYHDAAFSTFGSPVLRLGDIQLGIAVRVDNKGDNGSTWLRIITTLRKEAGHILVFVGGNEVSGVKIYVNYSEQDLKRICENLFTAALSSFQEDINVFVDGRTGNTTIGFLHS